jgi:hypothetical protein
MSEGYTCFKKLNDNQDEDVIVQSYHGAVLCFWWENNTVDCIILSQPSGIAVVFTSSSCIIANAWHFGNVVCLSRRLHEQNEKYMDERGYEDLVHKGRPDTSNTQIFIDKRSRPNIAKLEEACRLMEEEQIGLRIASHRVNLSKGIVKHYWMNVYKHRGDDDSGSEPEDDGAYMSTKNNAANLVASDSDEDEDDDSE